jgi:hypothetical protein
MTISELISELQRLRGKYGDIEIDNLNGRPLTQIIVDSKRPGHQLESVNLTRRLSDD